VLTIAKSLAKLFTTDASQSSRFASAGLEAHRSVLPPDRRGRLKNGNRSGDFLAAPRCGACTRRGGACRQPAMPNGRCRLHGGLSTGPRTPAGLARSRRARLTHGARSAAVRALLREARAHIRRARTIRARLAGSSAGYGVHRSISNPTDARPVPSCASAKSVFIRSHLCSSVSPLPFLSAGHGVHRSIPESPA
jgi:hypothetical protein